MSEEERSALAAKLDMMLVFMEQIRKDREECRKHCDASSTEKFDRINALERTISKLQGSFATHHWLLFTAELLGLFVLVYFGAHK